MFRIKYNNAVLYDPRLPERSISTGTLRRVVNKAGSLVFTLPPTNEECNTAKKLKGTIRLFEDSTEIFRGRVLDEEFDMRKCRKLSCEGALAFFNDSVVRPYEYHGSVSGYLQMLITQHNSQVEADRQFTLGNVTVTDSNDYIYRASSNYPDTWSEIEEKLIENKALGGYLLVRYVNGSIVLDYLAEISLSNDQEARFGSNIIDLSWIKKGKDIATVIVPAGARDEETGERLTIKSVNNNRDYIEDQLAIAKYGRISKTVLYDDVTLPSNLLAKATQDLAKGVIEAETYTVKAADLSKAGYSIDSFRFAEKLKVKSSFHDMAIEMLVSSMTLDLLRPEQSVISLGDEKLSYSSLQSDAIKKSADNVLHESLNSQEAAQRYLEELVANSTGLFFTEEEQEDESIITYAHDKRRMDESTLIIQIGSEAIAISNDGGETWPYGFIYTGTAILNKIYSVGIDAQYVNIGNKTLTYTLSNDYYTAQETEVQITAGINGFSSVVSQTYTTKTDFENLEIGGENLIRNTGDYRDCSYSSSEVSLSDASGEGVKIASFASYSSDLAWRSFQYFPSIPFSLIRGKTVTISYWYKSNSWTHIEGGQDYPVLSINVFDDENDTTRRKWYSIYGDIPAPTTQWQKFTKTVTLTDSLFSSGSGSITNNSYCSVAVFQHNKSNLQIKKLKLELGSKATDWSPAPADNTGAKMISMINQDASGVKITGQHLNFAGVTLNMTADNIAITSTNFSVTKDGEIVSKSGKIANWKIIGSRIESDYTGSGGYRVGIQNSGTSAAAGSAVFYAGCNTAENGTIADESASNFYVTQSGYLFCNNAKVKGHIIADTGKIGDWNIGSTSLYNGMESLTDTTNNGTYLGTDGIAFGKANVWIKADGSFKLGAVQSRGSSNEDLWVTNALHVSYGCEIYSDNINNEPYVDFRRDANGPSSTSTYDYTARISNTSANTITIQGQKLKTSQTSSASTVVVGTLTQTSDRRLKKYISSVDRDKAERFIKALKPARFEYRQDTGIFHHGFIYDEVEEAKYEDDWVVASTVENMFGDGVSYGTVTAIEIIPDIVAVMQKQLEDSEERYQDVLERLTELSEALAAVHPQVPGMA